MINLRPEIRPQFSGICYQCEYFPKVCGVFWIISDDLHISEYKLNKYQYGSEKHIMIDYKS